MTVARTMLIGIYEHSHFVNARLLDQAQLLSDAELDAERPGMFGSIRTTLLHMLQALQALTWQLFAWTQVPSRHTPPGQLDSFAA